MDIKILSPPPPIWNSILVGEHECFLITLLSNYTLAIPQIIIKQSNWIHVPISQFCCYDVHCNSVGLRSKGCGILQSDIKLNVIQINVNVKFSNCYSLLFHPTTWIQSLTESKINITFTQNSIKTTLYRLKRNCKKFDV